MKSSWQFGDGLDKPAANLWHSGMVSSYPYIAVVLPRFGRGGAELVVINMIEALAQVSAPALITIDKPHFQDIDRCYGSSLQRQEVKKLTVLPQWLPVNLSPLFVRYPLFRVRQGMLARFMRQREHQYDLVVSGFNELPLTKRSIQYIHCPGFVLSETEQERLDLKNHRVLTNSEFMRRKIRERYEIDCEALYPPSREASENKPWTERRNEVVVVSRLSAEKRIEHTIRVIERLREKGHDLTLTFLYQEGRDPYRRELLRSYKRRKVRDRWLLFCRFEILYEIQQRLTRAKFVFSSRIEEPYGLSLAEAIRAGCIPFAHRSGGPLEMLSHCPELTFETESEAIEKMELVLNSLSLQQDLRTRLRTSQALLTPKEFQDRFITIVKEELNQVSVQL